MWSSGNSRTKVCSTGNGPGSMGTEGLIDVKLVAMEVELLRITGGRGSGRGFRYEGWPGWGRRGRKRRRGSRLAADNSRPDPYFFWYNGSETFHRFLSCSISCTIHKSNRTDLELYSA